MSGNSYRTDIGNYKSKNSLIEHGQIIFQRQIILINFQKSLTGVAVPLYIYIYIYTYTHTHTDKGLFVDEYFVGP